MDNSTTPQIIASLLALGIALAFIVGEREAPTSRALSMFLASIGISIACFSQFELPLLRGNRYPDWGGIFAIPDVSAFYFGYEWLLRIRKTIPTRNLKTRVGDIQLRVAQLLAVAYGLLALAFPHMRAYEFSGGLSGSDLGPGFYLFAIPLGISLGLGIASGILTLNRRPDIAERQRLLSFMVATPFLASSMVLPTNLSPVMVSLGMLVFLVGCMQYYVIQGRRAQFMSRFLAPQVADLVREQGLATATREQTLELSVVCCDLRGFTAFAAAKDPAKVIQILREYYDAVGAAAGRAGGTIKDQAGDGVLILVGAPIAFDDHAQRALALAREIRAAGAGLTARWSQGDLQLGIGLGVATGFLSVGVIGTASRLEYAAVGSAVNLASRLCAEAADTEILADQRTADLANGGEAGLNLVSSAPRKLKGFVQPVPSYLLKLGE
jgi:adenylate cyclase